MFLCTIKYLSNNTRLFYSLVTGSIGMVSALVQTNPEAMDAELANQDLEAVDELDKELREEGINVSIIPTKTEPSKLNLKTFMFFKY